MSARRGRRFVVGWRWAVYGLGLLLMVALAWLIFTDRLALGGEDDPLILGIDAGVAALDDYRERIDIALRLQFLETALVDGRRSNSLRPDYRLIEEKLEGVLQRETTEVRGGLEAELDEVLLDLSRNRSAAQVRIENLGKQLATPAGPGRQGGQ